MVMNTKIINNYTKIGPRFLFIPLALLALIFLFLFEKNALSIKDYINVQKDLFYIINAQLSQFPSVMFNLTQLGDSLIFLSFLSIFVIYAPKMWEALIYSCLCCLVLSSSLKNLFSVPRPAAALDQNSFIIIGKTLAGHNSLPSGHSITVFTILTVLLFSFMPLKFINRIFWCFTVVIIGIVLVSTRIGVGAHFPLDVTIGSIIGILSGLLGILISKKIKIFSWISNKKSYPFFMILFLTCSIVLVGKILKENLVIYYFSLICLLFTLYKITYVYFKK
jgi:membrane-associated phospholipid phosphatase